MEKLNSISYKVKLLLPIPEDYGKVGENESVFVLPLDSRRWTKHKLDNIRWKYLKTFVKECDNIEWIPVEIENTGFSLELVQYEIFNDYGLGCYLVRIYHPKLNIYPFPIVTLVNAKELLCLISKSEFVSNNKIHGNFCCVHVDGTSGIWSTAFKLENPEDEDLKEKKEFGKKLSSERKTKKWIPGYTYFLTNGEKVLYIGQISNITNISETKAYSNYSSLAGGFSIATNLFGRYMSSRFEKKTGHLFIHLNKGGDIENFINGFGPEQNVSTVFNMALYNSANNNSSYDEIGRYYRFYFDNPKLGLQIEKRFLDDSKIVNLNEIINKFLVTYYGPIIKKGIVTFPICSEYDSFDEQVRKEFDLRIIENFKTINSNIKNPLNDFDVFYNTVTTNHLSGFCFSNSISINILTKIDKNHARELFNRII